MLRIGIALLVVILVFCAMMLVISHKRREEKDLQNRMAVLTGLASHKDMYEEEDKLKLIDRLRQSVKEFAQRLRNFDRVNVFDEKMQQAGWPLLGTEFELFMVGLGALFALAIAVTTFNIAFALLGFVIGTLLCMIVLSLQIRRRQAAFDNQLGDMLTMIANALRAGFSFTQALEHIAKEMSDPVSSEIGRVMRENALGIPLEDSLNSMVRRVGSADFNLVVAAVLIQKQVGGSLAQILDTISDTIAERIRMKREIKALTAQGRASGWVMAALPFGLAAIMSVISPGYLDPLFNEPMGQMAVGGACVSILIGSLIIKKIVDIEI